MSSLFRTTFLIEKPGYLTGYQETYLLLGSCFSDHIGERLQKNKFRTSYNPFGVIFNPVSLSVLLKWVKGEETDFDSHFVERDGLWFHYFFHSELHAETKEALCSQLEQQKTELLNFLSHRLILFLTFGTAWVYEKKETGAIVANCHKIPQKEFDKRLLSVEEITASVKEISRLFPESKLVLTVSPVRHLKDTVPLNAVSKSALRLACHQVQLELQNCFYFPSYELIMDDLRDYRFFNEDMIHPNQVAINYVWNSFASTFFTSETLTLLERWQKTKKQLTHRPLQPESEKHLSFLKKVLSDLKAFQDVFDVEAEISDVMEQISNFTQ